MRRLTGWQGAPGRLLFAGQLRTGVANMASEVREVSALFVDVVGSTRLAVRKDPIEVVAELNALFQAVVSASVYTPGSEGTPSRESEAHP